MLVAQRCAVRRTVVVVQQGLALTIIECCRAICITTIFERRAWPRCCSGVTPLEACVSVRLPTPT